MPTAASATPPGRSPIQLTGKGLGVVDFGSSVRTVTKAVSAVLGPPTGRPNAGCLGVYRQLAWHSLIVQFRHGRFTGYRYGNDSGLGSPLPPGSSVSPKLETARGITIGSTFGELKGTYRLTQTGTDFWMSNGIVFALLSADVLPSPPSSPIYEIKSYGVCPARAVTSDRASKGSWVASA